MTNLVINEQGRVTIPAAMRKELNVKAGDSLSAKIEGGRLVLESREAIIRRIQDNVAKCVPPGVSLVDELRKERQWEFEKELAELEAGK